MNMDIKIIQTIAAILVFVIVKIVTNKSIERTVKTHLVKKLRAKIIKKIISFSLFIIICTVILIIWGIDQSELVFFITSVLAVVGIALFAQWSILSNITAGLIIFFNHPVRLDDTVSIIDKDYEIEGRISDIGLFFVTIKNKSGEPTTVPNNVFLQKMVKRKIES